MIQLICIDVDGTLVGSGGVIPERVWTAAAAARSRGVHLALCSGRPAFGIAREYAERLDPAGWHVFQNGASVVNIATGESRSSLLDAGIVARLRARAADSGRVLELYDDASYTVEHDTERTRQHAALLGVPFQVRRMDSLAGPVVRAQWLVSSAEAEAVLAEPHDGLSVSASTSPVMPGTTFINMTMAGVDKAHAVRVVAGIYEYPLERVMMVGDSANDITAMQLVGAPVAMGNAEPGVRAVSRFEVAHVDLGGLADAIDLALTL